MAVDFSPSPSPSPTTEDPPVLPKQASLGDSNDIPKKTWKNRVLSQGPWDQVQTREMLAGAPSLPMPVEIATPKALAPFFKHLERNGDNNLLPELIEKGFPQPVLGEEPYYKTPYIEYGKGVVYADRRLDLCKMVVGPLSINALMDSLDSNTFVQHFLLGNNIIGPAGARRITKFIQQHPDRMETWYLAGNCIDSTSFSGLAGALAQSTATNVWLKRNPLTAAAAPDIAKLMLQSQTLRTLDLDQTKLSDEGIASLFDILSQSSANAPVTLQHLYLNATGLSTKAAASLANFLQTPGCRLQSLFMSNNPLSDTGAAALAVGLKTNTTLQRLMLASAGLTSPGAIALLDALAGNASLQAFSLGQSYATEDLNSRYSWLTDSALPSLQAFILSTPNLRYFVLDHTALSQPALNALCTDAVCNSASLCWFAARSVVTAADKASVQAKTAWKKTKGVKWQVRDHLSANVARIYGGMAFERFEAEEKRKLTGPEEDYRRIDSVYRNRDAGMARRGLKILDKWWPEEDGTLGEIMAS